MREKHAEDCLELMQKLCAHIDTEWGGMREVMKAKVPDARHPLNRYWNIDFADAPDESGRGEDHVRVEVIHEGAPQYQPQGKCLLVFVSHRDQERDVLEANSRVTLKCWKPGSAEVPLSVSANEELLFHATYHSVLGTFDLANYGRKSWYAHHVNPGDKVVFTWGD
jgi:hypothetical protein